MTRPMLRYIAVSVALAGFFFVSPLPHTTALRSLLLIILVGILFGMWRAVRFSSTGVIAAMARAENLCLALLTSWMLIQTVIWGVDRPASLGDFSREWLGSLLSAALAYGILKVTADEAGRNRSEDLMAWVVLALFAHAVWTIAFQALKAAQTGTYQHGSVPYGDYSVLSTPINMAFALLVADCAARWMGAGSLFRWSQKLSVFLLLIAATAVVAVKARNGVIAVLAVLAVLSVLLLLAQRGQLRTRSVAYLALLLPLTAVILLTINVLSDPRWNTFVETASIAVDADTHRAWLDKGKYPLPRLASGETVEASAYDRIAWGRIALEGIAARPVGYGYGLIGFGYYVKTKYGGEGFVSSHSGILDFTLANGVPGLVLLAGFSVMIFRRGLLSWHAGNPWGLALMLSLTNYFARIILDGHLGGYRLKMAALLIGILWWMTVSGNKKPS